MKRNWLRCKIDQARDAVPTYEAQLNDGGNACKRRTTCIMIGFGDAETDDNGTDGSGVETDVECGDKVMPICTLSSAKDEEGGVKVMPTCT